MRWWRMEIPRGWFAPGSVCLRKIKLLTARSPDAAGSRVMPRTGRPEATTGTVREFVLAAPHAT